MADYREQQEKYGSKVNKALTDEAYIQFLIGQLQDQGFGTAKDVSLVDGFSTRAVTVAEDATTKTLRVDYFVFTAPAVAYTIDQGLNYEWGQVVAIDALDVDITTTRNTYALNSLTFTNLNESDKDLAALDAAGVNANLASPFDYVLSDVGNLTSLSNGDTLIGTVVATDSQSNVTIQQITLNRQDRYIWGILDGTDTAANIATLLASETGNIIPANDDANFLELTTALGDFPSSITVNTRGEERTLFIATMDSSLEFQLPGNYDFPIDSETQSVNLNSISSGVANVSRTYNIMAINVNSNFTLFKK